MLVNLLGYPEVLQLLHHGATRDAHQCVLGRSDTVGNENANMLQLKH